MKKHFCLPGLLAAALLLLPGCSGSAEPKPEIAPYAFTEETQSVLEIFGMADTAALFTFQGPEEAITLRLRVETLGEDGTWREDDVGGTSIGEDRTPEERLSGALALELREDRGLDFHIRSGGLAAYRTEAPALETEPTASAWVFLPESRDLPLNEKVPVALLLWSGGALPACSLEDYWDPSRLAGLDLVQAVTVEFTDQAL